MKILCEQFPSQVDPEGCVSIRPRVWGDVSGVVHADWEHLKAEAVKYGVPYDNLKEAVRYCWEAWLDGLKSAHLDRATGWHVFCPEINWRAAEFRITFATPEHAKKRGLDTYKC